MEAEKVSVFEQYGRAMVQLEILHGQIQQLKKAIADEMNKPQEKKV